MTLKRAFKKAAKWTSGLILSFATVVGVDAGVRYLRDPNTVPLTDENKKYVAEYFGDKLDLTKVRIFNHRISFLQRSEVTMVPGGNTIYVPKGIDINKNKKLLVHELTHVYQNQNNIKNTGIIGAFKTWLDHSTYWESYYYTPDTTKALTRDYNLEQQGDIVAGYAMTRDWLYALYKKHETEGEKVLQPYLNGTEVPSHLKTYADLKKIINPDIPQAVDEWVDHLRLSFDMKKDQYIAMQDTVSNRHYASKITTLLEKMSEYKTTYEAGGGNSGLAAGLVISPADSLDTVYVSRAIKNLSGELSYEGIYVAEGDKKVLEIMGGEVLLYKPGDWERKLDSLYTSITETSFRPDIDVPPQFLDSVQKTEPKQPDNQKSKAPPKKEAAPVNKKPRL